MDAKKKKRMEKAGTEAHLQFYIDSNQMDVDLFWTFFKRKWKLP